MHADDRVLLHTIFEKAFSNQMSGADGYIHFMQMDGTVILVYMRVFFLREKDGCRQYYGCLMNVTEVQADKKLQMIGPADAAVAKVNDIYKKVLYFKHPDYGVLIQIKDKVEQLMEEKQGVRNVSVQFDFDPVNGF